MLLLLNSSVRSVRVIEIVTVVVLGFSSSVTSVLLMVRLAALLGSGMPNTTSKKENVV